METFNFKLTSESSGEIEHKVNETSFGDGYVQATSVGINNKKATWTVTAVGLASYTRPIINFIDRHQGAKSFYWTPPEGEQGRYRTSKYKVQNIGGNAYRISATFTQSYGVDTKAPVGTNVLSVNGETPDEYGDVTITAEDIGADFQGTATKAIDALKKESNPFNQYALKKEVPDVSQINEQLININKAVTEIDTDITNLQTGLTETNEYVAEVNAELETVSGELYEIKDNVATLHSAMVKSVNGITPDPATGNVKIETGTGGVEINDESPSKTTTFSGFKTNQLITNLKTEVDKKAVIDDSKLSSKTALSSQKTQQLLDNISNDLVNHEADNKGAALVAYSSELEYPTDTVGQALNDHKQAYTNLDERVKKVEKESSSFIIIYPNGGTPDNPAEIVNNKRYPETNPFPNTPVICVAELLINGVWADPGWFFAAGGQGTSAGHILETDEIIIQTGSSTIANASSSTGGLHGYSGQGIVRAPCRVKVWKIGGYNAE